LVSGTECPSDGGPGQDPDVVGEGFVEKLKVRQLCRVVCCIAGPDRRKNNSIEPFFTATPTPFYDMQHRDAIVVWPIPKRLNSESADSEKKR